MKRVNVISGRARKGRRDGGWADTFTLSPTLPPTATAPTPAPRRHTHLSGTADAPGGEGVAAGAGKCSTCGAPGMSTRPPSIGRRCCPLPAAPRPASFDLPLPTWGRFSLIFVLIYGAVIISWYFRVWVFKFSLFTMLHLPPPPMTRHF